MPFLNFFTHRPGAKSHRQVCVFVLLMSVFSRAGWSATESQNEPFVFQDTVPHVTGYESYAVRPWTEPEKQRVRQAVRTVRVLAPGVIDRATAYRSVNIYRSRDLVIRRALAIASPIRNGLFVTDRLLDGRHKKRVEDTLIHECAHLIDVAHLLEIDPNWTSAVLPRMQRVCELVRARGSTYFDVSFPQWAPGYARSQDLKYRQLAIQEGMPALYACTNLAEALAVCVERRMKGYRPPSAMDVFLQEHFFRTPFQADPEMQSVHAAMTQHVAGERDAALESYTALIESSSRFRTLTRFRAAVLSDQRKWEEAIADLTTALEVFRVSSKAMADIYKQRARCFMLQRKFELSIADINHAIELDGPGRSENYVARADVWKRMGKVDEAIQDLSHVIEIYPESQSAYQQRAYLWRRKGDVAKEEADWTKMIEVEKDSVYGLRQRAMLRNRHQRTEDAILDWTQILSRQPKDQTALVGRARAYETLNKFELAARDYQRLKISFPSAGYRYCVDLARCLVELGRYPAAIREWDAAIEQRGNYYIPYQEKAWLLATCPDASIRKGELAKQLAEKACELTNDRYCRCLEALAAAYSQMGDFQQAIQYQGKALEVARTETDKEAAQKRMGLYEAGMTISQAK